MAETFLSQLLTVGNRVESQVNAHCPVCLQKYGTLTDTGAMECEIRLPSNHTLGSMCACTWLKSKNTCPFCREVFFSVPPDPDFEHETAEDENTEDENAEDENAEDEDSEDEIMEDLTPNTSGLSETPELWDDDAEAFSDSNRSCCERLFSDRIFYMEVLCVAEPMALTLRDYVRAGGFGLSTLAATSIYIASHLLGHPRSSQKISRELLVQEHFVCSIYTGIFGEKEKLIESSMLEVLGRRHMDAVLAFLPPPDSQEDLIRDENERTSMPDPILSSLSETNARSLRLMCDLVCYQLGHAGEVVQLVQQIAKRIREGSYLGVVSDSKVTAVSIFMALHLLGLDPNFEVGRIPHFTGVAASIIQNTYDQLHPYRSRRVDPISLHIIGEYDMAKALRALISLSWPPLDPEIAEN